MMNRTKPTNNDFSDPTGKTSALCSNLRHPQHWGDYKPRNVAPPSTKRKDRGPIYVNHFVVKWLNHQMI